MERTRVVRVLILDGHRASGTDRMSGGVEVDATFEGHDALFYTSPDMGGYRLSEHSLDLAGAATPDLYDAVVIGNNEWVGLHKAARIPEAMRARTLIVWNHLVPGEEARYREMGFTHFGQRYSRAGECDLGVREFIGQIAAEMAGA